MYNNIKALLSKDKEIEDNVLYDNIDTETKKEMQSSLLSFITALIKDFPPNDAIKIAKIILIYYNKEK